MRNEGIGERSLRLSSTLGLGYSVAVGCFISKAIKMCLDVNYDIVRAEAFVLLRPSARVRASHGSRGGVSNMESSSRASFGGGE